MRRLLELGVIVFAGVLALTPLPRGAVERVYSRGVYPVIQPRLTALSNAVRFPLFDVALLVVAIAVPLWWVVRLRQGTRGRSWHTVAWLLADTAAFAAVLYCWFLVTWGLNYQREPLRAQLDFREERITSDGLRALARRDVDALNVLYDAANRRSWPEFDELPPVLGPAYLRAQGDLALPWRARAGRPKRSLLNFYFTRVSVDGMTDPFFLETLANQSLLPFERSFVVAHEWSHLAGYADESEANFMAWLICMRGAEQEKYSAWISLYGTIVTALPRLDRADVAARLQPGPRRDLGAMSERISRQVNPAASRAGYAIYDQFLKANRVQAGIRSYDEVIRLLLGTRFSTDGGPELRN
jgi:Protein of unknown function (DUF3810)